MAACIAFCGCAVHREATRSTPVIVGIGGDTALDGAMTTWVKDRVEKTEGLDLVSETAASTIYVQFANNVRVTGNNPDQKAEYRVNYRRDGKALGQRVGACDLDELNDCAREIVEDLLNYARNR